MPRIAFTRRLEDIAPCEPATYDGATVRAVLYAVSADFPRLRSYVLDDQGRVRKHVAVFVDGALQPADVALEVPVTPSSEIYVMQALSGG